MGFSSLFQWPFSVNVASINAGYQLLGGGFNLPLWKIYESMGFGWHPMKWKINENHPAMFQTTNQFIYQLNNRYPREICYIANQNAMVIIFTESASTGRTVRCSLDRKETAQLPSRTARCFWRFPHFCFGRLTYIAGWFIMENPIEMMENPIKIDNLWII